MNYISKLAAVDHVRELVALLEAADDCLGAPDVGAFDASIDKELADLALICAPDRWEYCSSAEELYCDLRRCLRRLASADVKHVIEPGYDRDADVSAQLELVAGKAVSVLVSELSRDGLDRLFAERAAKFNDVPVDFTRSFLKGVAR